jgi:hypothetical protein
VDKACIGEKTPIGLEASPAPGSRLGAIAGKTIYVKSITTLALFIDRT